MLVRSITLVTLVLLGSFALAQQAPPPPPASAGLVAPQTPGLSPELAEAAKMIHDGQYAAAQAKIGAVLAGDARNPQARFLKGIVEADQGEVDAALSTFQALTQDFPELPEPHNNLAVIFAQQGRYEDAKSALEQALAASPDYAIAHENLGDIYTRLAGGEYDKALALDKTNKSAEAKLALVRDLFAVSPSSPAPKLPVPVPKPAPKPKK
jgi:tetratricopeptide (TPR) repeat protein